MPALLQCLQEFLSVAVYQKFTVDIIPLDDKHFKTFLLINLTPRIVLLLLVIVKVFFKIFAAFLAG